MNVLEILAAIKKPNIKHLKVDADYKTHQENRLKNIIETDATRLANDKHGYRDEIARKMDKNFPKQEKMWQANKDHFIQTSPSMAQLKKLSQEAAKARLAHKKALRMVKASDEEDKDLPGKKIDYGEHKIIKHVNPALPHPNPKTLSHYQANLVHLKKLNNNNKVQIEHHTYEHKRREFFRDRILPLWHRMGYTTNKASDARDIKSSLKFHSDKLEHYSKLNEQTKTKLAQHKAKIASFTPAKSKVPAIKKKTPMKMAASLASLYQLSATNPTEYYQKEAGLFPVKKDGFYYKRLAKLFHLKIDRDVSKDLTSARGKTGAEISTMYNDKYHAHPLFKKLHKSARKAAKMLATSTSEALQ